MRKISNYWWDPTKVGIIDKHTELGKESEFTYVLVQRDEEVVESIKPRWQEAADRSSFRKGEPGVENVEEFVDSTLIEYILNYDIPSILWSNVTFLCTVIFSCL